MNRMAVIAALWLWWASSPLLAQAIDERSPAVAAPADPSSESIEVPNRWPRHLSDFTVEQLRLWKAPFHLNRQDSREAAAILGFGAGLIAIDSPLSRVSTTAQERNLTKASNVIGAAASWSGSLGFLGAFYLSGRLRHDAWQQDTASLALRSALHASLITVTIKRLAGRERPLLENHRGRFGNVDQLSSGYQSFPSGHASSAWAIASVVASRYPKTWVRWTSYGSAALISVSRVTGKKHFYADIFIGSYLGYKIGKWVVKGQSAGRH